MPIFIEGRPVLGRWTHRQPAQTVSIDSIHALRSGCIRIALINNMPDAALEDTEFQFFTLLDSAAGNRLIRLRLYSLPGIPRTERGRQHLKSFYSDLSDLWTRQFDAVIVTGTEPCAPTLQNEPYWPQLTQLIDWAERNTVSSVWSCLAAHASVLHGDGIERRRLGDKRFGVFELTRIANHALTSSGEKLRFPHSRWNDIPADALLDAGYTVLTASPIAGVDCFCKVRQNSLFLHFQGHPEYEGQTLFKEYRRDIRRFLKGERESYPSMPQGYFDSRATTILGDFQRAALSHRHEDAMTFFPEESLLAGLENGWRHCATSMYRNWLSLIEERRCEIQPFTHRPGRSDELYRRRSIAP
jgi:homoserine O-succinyltransferase/O-acetyltransferase